MNCGHDGARKSDAACHISAGPFALYHGSCLHSQNEFCIAFERKLPGAYILNWLLYRGRFTGLKPPQTSGKP